MYLRSGAQQALCCALVSPMAVFAQAEVEEIDRRQRGGGQIVVTATKTKRSIEEVPASITAIDQDQLMDRGSKDIKDALVDELDIAVKSAGKRYAMSGAGTGRAGNEGINIRGLEGNQVLMIHDGIRMPQSFAFGPFSVGRGDYLSMDGLGSIEILRGPASTLYGSDGLAGIVNFRTLEYEDIKSSGKESGPWRASLGASMDTVDHSQAGVATLGYKNNGYKTLILSSIRHGHERDNQGVNDQLGILRTSPNPMDYRSRYGLVKFEKELDSRNRLALHAEQHVGKQSLEVLSARGISLLGVRARSLITEVSSLDTQDYIERNRISLKHRYRDWSNPYVQKLSTHVYWQISENRQKSLEQRTVNGEQDDRVRDNTYRESLTGISSQFESHFDFLATHRLTYGVDLSQSTILGLRDGVNPTGVEVFPSQPFPKTHYQLVGLYWQDEIDIGRVTLIPGIRFDHYRLTPENGSNSGSVINQGSSITPRLGLIWKKYSILSPYVQYATGFRAPSPDQVNSNFENRMHGYVSVPNPNLRPECSRSLEYGLKGRLGAFNYTAAYFDNRYDDFISQEKVGGSGTPIDPSIYQYTNLTSASIRGWDLRTNWYFGRDWQAHIGFSALKGNSSIGEEYKPLNSIEPMKVMVGIQYTRPQVRWYARWRYAFQKSINEVSDIRITANQMADQYIPPAAGVVDLGLTLHPSQRISIRANINNVFDSVYWNWSDVRGVPANSPVLDAYTAPGRSLSLSARINY